jgi:pimeloyl-ACP methyl ester carboxylesterase
MRIRRLLVLLGLLAILSSRPSIAAEPGLAAEEQELVRQALWGPTETRHKALTKIRSWTQTPERLRDVEKIIRAGRAYGVVKENAPVVPVTLDATRKTNVLVQLPPNYDPSRRYPLMIAIGGGPSPNEEGARDRGKTMLRLWSKPASQAGWIVAAVEDTVSVRLPGKELRYHILNDDHLRAIRHALLDRYAIDVNRVHVTGISLGSNYAIAYGAAHPDWLAGIAPVSTEGESREHVVRNLRHVAVYTLEGAKDKNIRTIEGPRKQAQILKALGYAHVYEEDAAKGHVGFIDRYPEVLKWLAARPRPAFPKEVVRLPHPGIIMPGRRFYWVEADTHQAAFAVKVNGNTIVAQAARARRLTFHLSGRLLDLDAPVTIRINDKIVHEKRVQGFPAIAVEDAAALDDTERFASARITVEVPDLAAGEKWLATLAPQVEPSTLPYWEHYAMTTLKEKRPTFPADLEKVKDEPAVPAGQTALRVSAVPEGSPLRSGDLVLQVDGEPLFAGADSIGFLRDYLIRTWGDKVELRIQRDGKPQVLAVALLRSKK